MTAASLDSDREQQLVSLARTLVDQQAARVIVAARKPATGFWFGGGNMISEDGVLYLVGRYRNEGDSRTGLGLGDRGLELAIFRSIDLGQSFHQAFSFSKADLAPNGHTVVSIEGSALLRTSTGIELYVSSEKSSIAYPGSFQTYQKPDTGVWSIDRLQASSFETLPSCKCREVLHSIDPEYLHVKDPWIHRRPSGRVDLGFCSHPFNWTSSNMAVCTLDDRGNLGDPNYRVFPRGTTWDVAMSRGTCVLDVPRVGRFRDQQVSLLFYDGGECVRKLDEHASAVKRPRGYSCEELGGLAYMMNYQWDSVQRLSRYAPLLVSPWGTGCSRYVSVLSTDDGMYATWQQSQADYSQPLVMHFVKRQTIEAVLS